MKKILFLLLISLHSFAQSLSFSPPAWLKNNVAGETTKAFGPENNEKFIFGSNGQKVGEYNSAGKFYGWKSIGVNSGFADFSYQTTMGYNFVVGGKAAFGYHTNMPTLEKTGTYFLDVAKQYSSDISRIRFAKWEASGIANVPKWYLEHGSNDDFAIKKVNTNFSIDTTNSIYINGGRFNFGRSTGLNNSKFTFGGSSTFTGDIFYNSTQSLSDNLNLKADVDNPVHTGVLTSPYIRVSSQSDGILHTDETGNLYSTLYLTKSEILNLGDSLNTNKLVLPTGSVQDLLNDKLSISSASSTYFPKTSGVLYGLTSIRKKTAYNSSDTLFTIGGLGSDIGGVGQTDRLEFKQVSVTGVPRWDISNYVAGSYQTNLSFLSGNIGIKRTNPSYSLDVNGTFRAVGNSIFDGNIGIGLTNPLKRIDVADIMRSTSNFGGLEAVHASGTSYRWTLNNDNQFYLQSSTDKFVANASTRMTIDNNGNVGIGTTTPNAKLHSYGTGYVKNIIQTTATNAGAILDFVTGSRTYSIGGRSDYATGALHILDETAGVSRLMINNGGNVGIGLTSPSTKLDIANGSGQYDTNLTLRNSSHATSRRVGILLGNTGASFQIVTDLSGNGTNDFAIFDNVNFLTRFMINNAGNVGIGTTSPNYRLQINDITSGNVGINSNGTFHINYQSEAVPRITIDRDAVGGGNAGIIFKTGSTGTNAANGSAIGSPSSQKLALYTSNGTALTERMIIDGNGNVGVGTTSPSKKLTVSSPSGDYGFYAVGNGTAGNNNGVLIDAGLNTSDYALRVRSASSAEYFAVRGDGNVGIGTHQPTNKLSVSGGVSITNGWTRTMSLDANYPIMLFNSTASSKYAGIGYDGTTTMNFWVNGSTEDVVGTGINAMSIKSSNGNIGLGTTTPNAALQFGNIVANRRLVLFEETNNDHQFYGFGINASMIRYQVSNLAASHNFFAASSSSTSVQLFSINGDKTVTYTPLTTSEINALVKGKGKMAYNSDTDKMVYCTGSAGVWKYFDGTNM